MTIPGISNWCEWTWPIEGEYACYIKTRAIPNLGNWILFSPSQIQNFVKGEINQPSPQLSESTKPKSPWKIPIPHASKLCLKRLGLQELTSELQNRGIDCLHLRNRSMLNKKYNTRPMNDEEFPLSSGWATKEVQKYGKKGGGKRIKKRISTILEQYFLAGNVDKTIDHWSIDARQDAWFSASSLHSAIENLEIKPKWISIISDNGPHYHNSELMIIMSKWFEWYGIYVKKWIFLEAGEAKTTVDSHYAQISLSIKRYIKIGGEIQEGNDITLAIQDVAGTSVAHIEPNRNRGKKSLILNYK
ncbi:hypothetical protein Glove_543g11 [Diversispora epigaea]|uniref:Uncharacterized protein n=1 Tax=Diversispora epigaea TaxID=1348612 RepID=A0A397GCH1_9GLOM|nr:hypothetical protein Glove_543g11 [Diversispora epigaea]